MSFFATLLAILKCLPELIKILQAVEKKGKERAVNTKVKDNLKELKDALENNDIDKVRAIFKRP